MNSVRLISRKLAIANSLSDEITLPRSTREIVIALTEIPYTRNNSAESSCVERWRSFRLFCIVVPNNTFTALVSKIVCASLMPINGVCQFYTVYHHKSYYFYLKTYCFL